MEAIHLISNFKQIIGKQRKDIHERFIFHLRNDSWGTTIYIMEMRGRAYARVYWMYDEIKVIYLEGLSVNESIRRKGIGKLLQEIREDIGRIIGANTAYLWVKKDSWMHEWYIRRGYVDYKNYIDDSDSIWMKKLLK